MPVTQTSPATEDRGKPLFITASLLTAALVTAYFAKNHVPFGDLLKMAALFLAGPIDPMVLFANYLRFGLSIVCALGAVLAYGAVGRRVSRWAGWTWDQALLDLPFAFALGGSLYGLCFQGLGLAGAWSVRILATAVGLGILLALVDLVGAVRAGLPRLTGWRVDRYEGAALAACLPLVLLALWHGMTGEIFYDTQVYHLAVPEAYLARHGFSDLPGLVFAHFPFGGEWFFWGGYILGGPSAAKIVSFTVTVAVAMFSGGLARRLGGEGAGVLAAVLMLSCPLLNLSAWSSSVEGVLALEGLVFLAALLRTRETPGEAVSWWAATGWFLASAVAVKYNGILLAVFLLLPLLASPERFRPKARTALAFLVPGALALGPHLIKNIVFAGNPVYPYASGYFGGRYPWAQGLKQMLLEQRQWQVSRPEDWIALPWRMFTESPNGYNFLGPVVLTAPLWIAAAWLIHRLGSRKERPAFPPIGTLTAGAAMLFGLGLTITHLPRFLMPGYAPLYVAAACACAAWSPTRRLALVTVTVCALGALPILLLTTFAQYTPQGVWTGREGMAPYLQRAGVTPYTNLMDLVQQAVLPGERVLIAGDARGMGYARQVVASSVFDLPLLAEVVKGSEDGPGIWRALRRKGIDAVLVNVEEGIRTGGYGQWNLSPEEWTRFHDFVRHGLRSLRWETKGVLFHLQEEYGAHEMGVGVPDPFLYLAPQAGFYAKAAEAHEALERDRLLDELSALQTFTTQWYEEKAVWHIQEGKTREAEEDWKIGSQRGPLQKGSYMEWRRILETERRLKELDHVTREAQKYYPG